MNNRLVFSKGKNNKIEDCGQKFYLQRMYIMCLYTFYIIKDIEV